MSPLSLQTTRFTRASINTNSAEPDYATRGVLDLSEAHTMLRTSAFTTASPDGLVEDGELTFTTAPATTGGIFCGLIARRRNPVYALALVVLILGSVEAAMVIANPKSPGPRTETPEMFSAEAMENTQQPALMVIAHPVIGVLGVLGGGLFIVRRSASRESSPPME